MASRREVNDYRRRAFGQHSDRLVAFVCECTGESCRRAVLLTISQYDEARSLGRAVVVDPSHEPAGDDPA
jgi:hypothetical protein